MEEERMTASEKKEKVNDGISRTVSNVDRSSRVL